MPTEVRLPLLGSSCVEDVRRALTAPGFSLVKSPWSFEDSLHLRLARQRTVLPCHTPRWQKFPELARYACWLEELLQEALPDEGVALKTLEFRHEPAGSEDAEVDRLHVDGSYIRSVCTLLGLATLYRTEGVELPVPKGHTLLMTAYDRARLRRIPGTLHRRPGAGPERMVIVCSFEPRTEPAPPTNIYVPPTPRYRGRRRRSQGCDPSSEGCE